MSEQRAELKLAVMASLGHGCPVLALVGRIAAPILRIMDDDWAARTPPAAVPPACSSPSLTSVYESLTRIPLALALALALASRRTRL